MQQGKDNGLPRNMLFFFFATLQKHCLSVLNSPEKRTLTVLYHSLEQKPWCAIPEIREHCQSLLRQSASDRFIFYTRSSLERNRDKQFKDSIFIMKDLNIKSIHYPCSNNKLSINFSQIPKKNCGCWLFDNGGTSRVHWRQFSSGCHRWAPA